MRSALPAHEPWNRTRACRQGGGGSFGSNVPTAPAREPRGTKVLTLDVKRTVQRRTAMPVPCAESDPAGRDGLLIPSGPRRFRPGELARAITRRANWRALQEEGLRLELTHHAAKTASCIRSPALEIDVSASCPSRAMSVAHPKCARRRNAPPAVSVAVPPKSAGSPRSLPSCAGVVRVVWGKQSGTLKTSLVPARKQCFTRNDLRCCKCQACVITSVRAHPILRARRAIDSLQEKAVDGISSPWREDENSTQTREPSGWSWLSC